MRKPFLQITLRAAALLCFFTGAHHVIAQAPARGEYALTLPMLFDSVRSTHPTLRAASSRVRAAEGDVRTAHAFGNPMVSYQIEQASWPGGRPLVGMSQQSMAVATFPLEGLYQRKPRITAANADVRMAEAQVASSRQQLGLEASAAFYRAAMAQVQVATTRDLLTWLDSLVAYNGARVKEGVTAGADLLRSELERDRVNADQSIQEAELAEARAALGAFVSDPDKNILSPSIVIGELPLPLPNVVDAQIGIPRPASASASNRPEVRAAAERVNATNAQISAERAMTVRDVGLTVGTMQAQGMSSLIAGIALPLPVFDRNGGRMQRATAERDDAVFVLAAQERNATAELRGAIAAAQILTARTILISRRDSSGILPRAEESRRISLGAYREGAIPLFQVIDAARAWSDARMTFYRTLFAQHQSVLKLMAASGVDLLSAPPQSLTSGGLPR